MSAAPAPRFQVRLALTAPGAVPPTAAEEALRLLASDGVAARWSSVVAQPTDHGIELCVVCGGADAQAASDAVVDGVRALAGLDATFTRWVVEARRVVVEELPA